MNETAQLPASMKALRPYQRQCLERLRQRYREGKRRMLVSLATGTGKTIIFAQFPNYFRMKKRLLVLAHREELLEQALEKFHDADPNLPVEIEQAGLRGASQRWQIRGREMACLIDTQAPLNHADALAMLRGATQEYTISISNPPSPAVVE